MNAKCNNKETNFISAVVYIRNNQDIIEDFLKMLIDFLSMNFKKYEIICVNDCSTDGSEESIRRYAESCGESQIITLLNTSYYQGLETSMNAGVDLSIGDFVYEFDSTYISYSPELLKTIYNRCLQGFDIVSACLKLKGHFIGKSFYAIYNYASGSQYKIQTEAFRILSRRAINRVHSLSKTLLYRKALYANCGLQQDTIFFESIVDFSVAKKKERKTQFETAQAALIIYTNIAQVITAIFTVIPLVAAFLSLSALLIIKSQNHMPAQWISTMLIVSTFSFLTNLILLFLIKYAALILKAVFSSQKYVIKSIEKINLNRKSNLNA